MTCSCFPCRRRTMRSLRDVAPRLARARDELVAERTAARAWRRWHSDRELHLLWLVAHRELQLERANARGNGRYIDQRWRKLGQARGELAAHQALAYDGDLELQRAA